MYIQYTSRNTCKPYICFISKILNSFLSEVPVKTRPLTESREVLLLSLASFDRQETVCESDCLRQWEANRLEGPAANGRSIWDPFLLVAHPAQIPHTVLSMYERRVSAGNNLNAGFNLKFYKSSSCHESASSQPFSWTSKALEQTAARFSDLKASLLCVWTSLTLAGVIPPHSVALWGIRKTRDSLYRE